MSDFSTLETTLTIKLHGIAASRAARPLWMLEELGVPYERVAQTYLNNATRTPAFLALNPNGHIPVLEDDGIVVWESMATTLYLARRFGGPLAPATLAEEAEVLRWTFWSVTECEKDALARLASSGGAAQNSSGISKTISACWKKLEKHRKSPLLWP